MQLTLIYNLESGDGEHSGAELQRRLVSLGHRVRVQNRDSDDFPSALAEPTDLVVVAGGDGTVAKVIRKIPDRRTPITILPLGTANNIARSFGIAGSVEDLASGWKTGAEHRLDLFEAGGVWGRKSFVEGLAFGCLTKGMMRSRGVEGNRQEQLIEARARIMKALKRAKPKRWRMRMDGKTVSGEYLFVELLNITHMGPGIPLSAGGNPGDGMLDIVTLRARGREALLDWLKRDDGSPPPVTHRKAKTVEIVWDRAPSRLDDDFREAPGHVTRVLVEHSGQSGRILVPGGLAGAKSKQ